MYGAFASIYDWMMEEIPYEEWCDFTAGLLREYGVEGGLLLELGCGTGTLTEMFAKKGYDMIGLDSSEEMLVCAMEKRAESGSDILYLHQDMREFELYGTVGAVVSLCDTMNYLTSREELVKVLKLVNNYLDPGGIFIFDLKTVTYFSEVVGNQTFAETEEGACCIWQNNYEEETRKNQYLLTLFLQEEDGRYSRSEELHEQRAYFLEEIRQAIREAGMEFVAAYDGCSRRMADEKTHRMYLVAREQGKAGKKIE